MKRHTRQALLTGSVVLTLAAAFGLACGNSGDPANPDPGPRSTGNSVKDAQTDISSDNDGSRGEAGDANPLSPACAAASANAESMGCEFYAVDMLHSRSDREADFCFAAAVVNGSNGPAKIGVDYKETALDMKTFARLVRGSGKNITYEPFEPSSGIPANEVALLFLVGGTRDADASANDADADADADTSSGAGMNAAPCPVPAAFHDGVMLKGNGVGSAFHLVSDAPVAVYQLNPFGGSAAGIPGSSMLLPTATWGMEYIAVNAYAQDDNSPSMNIVGSQNGTALQLVPTAKVQGGGGLPTGDGGTTLSFTLAKAEHAQFSQGARGAGELTGSILKADKPIGFLAGQTCMFVPAGVADCDHGEQMVPPVSALGHEHVGVMYKPRAGEPAIWRIIGVEDQTTLTYSDDVGGPSTLLRGEIAEFVTRDPFVVRSQDAAHPFLLFAYMSGSAWSEGTNMTGLGDPEFVFIPPPEQFLDHYSFFADPSFPETNLVVVRSKKEGAFADVQLDCAGTLTGWQAVGDYEWTRVDLTSGDFAGVGNCSAGARVMTSSALFGVWVWGWGENASYGYPAGMRVAALNAVHL